MKFVWIPGGEFGMGSKSGKPDERPVHKVRLDGFWLGVYEVTQDQWEKIMGANPFYSHCDICGKTPAERASWEDVQAFIQQLNSRSGRTFRLPTEAEWEYACLAGVSGQPRPPLDDIAWYKKNSGIAKTWVGGKKPNAWGLYDMLGNVGEWCQDWYDEGYYRNSPPENPPGPPSSPLLGRVVRGGSWASNAKDVRPSERGFAWSSQRSDLIGFRLVRSD